MNRQFKIVTGIVISISLLVSLIYYIDLRSVIETLLAFDKRILLIMVLIYLISMIFRTIRWNLLIEQREKINNIVVFKALAIGYLINNLLPAKVGELARMEYLKRKQGIGRSFLLGTIFIERLLDVLIVIVIFAFSLILSQTGNDEFVNKQWLIYALAGIIIPSGYFMLKPQFIKWFIRFVPKKLKSRFEQIVKSFSEAILFIKNRRLLIGVGFLSVLIWVLTLLSVYIILWGLGITLPVHAYFFLVAASVFGIAIPSTSGGIGVYHAIATGALLLFNVVPEKALAYAVIAHAFDFFPNILLGGSLLLFENSIMKEVLKNGK